MDTYRPPTRRSRLESSPYRICGPRRNVGRSIARRSRRVASPPFDVSILNAIQRVIEDMKALLKDPDLARLFENTFPNTLDTTVRYFNQVTSRQLPP